MLKFAADLSDDHEYFVLWTGQSTSGPWGTLAEGASLFPEFDLDDVGVDLGTITIPLLGSRPVGLVETLAVSATLTAGEWSNTKLRLGTVALSVIGYATVLRNTASTITVEWIVSPGVAAATPAGYLFRDDFKWASYPQVRVCTPMQPTSEDVTSRNVPYPGAGATWALGGRGLTLPAPYSVPSGVTTFEDLGLMLDLTLQEGINGFGISEGSDSRASPATHAITGIAGNVWTFGNAIDAVGMLDHGRLIVDWEDGTGGPMQRSWCKTVAGSTATTFTVDGAWLGDGDPGTTASQIKRYTCWLPHYLDSPHAYLPGEGFTYPNNDHRPCFKGEQTSRGAVIRNRPRGFSSSNYGDQFGDLLVFCSRLSAATGKRINAVVLQANASGLAPSNTNNMFGFKGILGWWDYRNHMTWAPSLQSSLYQRLVKLVTTIMPNALLAEGNTRTPRFLCHVHCQGETDAIGAAATGSSSSRQHYGRSLKAFVSAVRSLITGLGYSPYANGAKIPFIQPRIATVTYELVGTYNYYGVPFTFNGDEYGVVNGAIVEHAVSDGFGGSVTVNDLPRILTDPGHYNGVGEAVRGARLSDVAGRVIDYALSHGSTALSTPLTRLVDLCNIALSHIGHQPIASLEDGTHEASLCARFLPEARDMLLQARQWGFAKRRVQLQVIPKPEEMLYQHFDYCYVMPADALNAFAVLPPVTMQDEFDVFRVLGLSYSTEFVANGGAADEVEDDISLATEDEIPGVRYVIEQSPNGGRLIFTNQAQATLRYTARVIDASLYSPLFFSAHTWYLAAMLATSLIKGDQGEAVSQRCIQKAAAAMRMATSSDAQQSTPKRPFDQIPGHLKNR